MNCLKLFPKHSPAQSTAALLLYILSVIAIHATQLEVGWAIKYKLYTLPSMFIVCCTKKCIQSLPLTLLGMKRCP